MYIKDTHHPSIHLYLNSLHKNSGCNQCLEFIFDHSIQVDQYHQFVLTVEHFSFPLSYYNINSNNNQLVIEYEDGDIDNITIESGNYDLKSLTEYIDNLGLKMSKVTYDSKRNKIFLVCDQSFNISGTGHVFNFDNEVTQDGDYFVYSSFVNLSGLSELHLHSNLSTSNMSSRENGHSNVLCMIPVNGQNNEVINYNSDLSIKLHESTISKLNLEITDEIGNPIEIEDNCHWTATLRIDYVRKKTVIYADAPEVRGDS